MNEDRRVAFLGAGKMGEALVSGLIRSGGRAAEDIVVTATSGSGPAYFALLSEAMIDGCILLGLSRDVATALIVQTMLGSAKMLRDTGMHPVEVREMVTSPGGTTIAAIRHLEQAGVRAAFLNAIEAARQRSSELAKGSEAEEL